MEKPSSSDCVLDLELHDLEAGQTPFLLTPLPEEPDQETVDRMTIDFHLHLADEALQEAQRSDNVRTMREQQTKIITELNILLGKHVWDGKLYLSATIMETGSPQQREQFERLSAIAASMRTYLECCLRCPAYHAKYGKPETA